MRCSLLARGRYYPQERGGGEAMKRMLVAVGLFTVSLAAHADFKSGLAAYQHEDYAAVPAQILANTAHATPASETATGDMYFLGQGVPQDFVEALKWYQLAAKQGYASAQNKIGLLYEHGLGVQRDNTEAAKWYRLAAQQRDASAANNLGLLYARGQGVPQNYVEAYKWQELSKTNAMPGSVIYKLATEHMNSVAQHMTPAQITQARHEASVWSAAHPKEKIDPLNRPI